MESRSTKLYLEKFDMALSSQAIRDFIRAYQLDCGIVLSEREARTKAEEIMNLFKTIAKPVAVPVKVLK